LPEFGGRQLRPVSTKLLTEGSIETVCDEMSELDHNRSAALDLASRQLIHDFDEALGRIKDGTRHGDVITTSTHPDTYG